MKGITVSKKEDFSEWYSQVVAKADLADIRFGIQGFIVHKPWGFYIIKKMYEFLEAEVEKQGHVPFLFPRAVKESDLTREAEHAGFTPEVFWVSEAGSKKIEERFALPPTGEAQIYPMYALWFRSHGELPFKGYQSRISVFRHEMTTRPFLRGREFLFFETHNVYYGHHEALAQIEQDLETCETVIRGICKIPFLYFKRPDWDRFKGANATFTPDTLMPDGKRNQLASTHDLGTNFAEAYAIKVFGPDEKEHYVYQTCFGPGVWRIMAAMIGIHGDDTGLVLPFVFPAIQIVIIPIILTNDKEGSQKVVSLSKKIEKELQKAGYRVRCDNSEDSPGSKYSHWEMLGVPIRIEVGPKEAAKESCSLVIRTERERHVITVKSLVSAVKKYAQKLDKDIHERAETYFTGNTRIAKNYNELKSLVEKHRGFVRIPFCTVGKEGEACADQLKADTKGGYVCGTLYPQPQKPQSNDTCFVCQKKATAIVYVAKSY